MPRYDVLVDGQRQVRVKSEGEVREWIRGYRDQHAQDDPDATHVQVIRLKLMGGTVLPRERFF